MKADPRFLRQPKEFWAHVRTISQEVGYTDRTTKVIRIPTLAEIRREFLRLGLTTAHIADDLGNLSAFGQVLFDYFQFRASVLNERVQVLLMTKDSARAEFERLQAQLNTTCSLPMNKQTGDKKNYAFLTGIVNMLIQTNIGGAPCDYDPRSLTTMTHNAMPLRTLARRVDGAFPSVVNPVAIWEIKEYYYTTTFGSRVADGVYETLLDGMELEELEAVARRKVHHLLVVDDHFTWWQCGRSYLCRIIDMLHMGFVDEVMFGREVLTRLPELAREWKETYDKLSKEAGSHSKIGDVLMAQGDLAGALAAYRKGLAIRETLAARDRDNVQWQIDVAVSCSKLGTLATVPTSQRRQYLERGRDILVNLKSQDRLPPNQDHRAWFESQLKALSSS